MAKVLIIYGSSSGNTELTCQQVAEVLQKHRHKVILQRVESTDISDLRLGKVVILAAPTYEHGVIQHHFFPFLKQLKDTDLKGKPMAVIGLGDDKYDDHYNVESANILEKAIKESHGELICHALRVNKNPITQLTERITEWAEDLSKLLL